jgi:hypothetical protein
MVGFLTIAWISLLVNIHNFLFHCHILGLELFCTLSFQKFSIAFYFSLLVVDVHFVKLAEMCATGDIAYDSQSDILHPQGLLEIITISLSGFTFAMWQFFNTLSVFLYSTRGPGSSVGIATGYGLDGPGDRIPVGARFSAPVQTGPRAHPAFCTMGTGSFPGVESGGGVTLTPHPLLVPRSKNRVELYPYSP